MSPGEVPLWDMLKLVFIHVPRTGGTTVRGILTEIAVHYGLASPRNPRRL